MKNIVSICVSVLLMSVCAQAENSARSFKEGKTLTGGVIDNEVIFTYNKEMKIESESDLELIKNIAKQKICSSSSARAIIVKEGMSVKYIYIGKENTVIVKIDNCQGIKAE